MYKEAIWRVLAQNTICPKANPKYPITHIKVVLACILLLEKCCLLHLRRKVGVFLLNFGVYLKCIKRQYGCFFGFCVTFLKKFSLISVIFCSVMY